MSEEFKYDVAFSFLARDLEIAQDLAERLEPGLTTFVYARRQEELLGGDGMDQFGDVFSRDARLTVILYRGPSGDKPGWAETPWTSFEESHIKSRALETQMTSFMVVKMDDAPLRKWMPRSHLWAPITESRDALAAVIRARARETGATVSADSAIDVALRRHAHASSEQARAARMASEAAVTEVRREVQEILFPEIKRLTDDIVAARPGFDLTSAHHGDECAIVSVPTSTSVRWQPEYSNSLTYAVLRIVEWRGRITLPSQSERIQGRGALASSHFEPFLSEDDDWSWRYVRVKGDELSQVIFVRPDQVFRSLELADVIVRRQIGRLFPGGQR